MNIRPLSLLILFSLLLNACGQQGPLFMPIENEAQASSSQAPGSN